ncbi:hypothetical protein KIN34_14670 [Cellulomonas sp. DKR-3]|uniref:Tyr recombinase domain-containing protein n=1 Tax=Cellulomonas fulva TaxID=2835530 RepID=A0ABS5U2C3_9CELL|nr:hypothetical protein [Cellulomonas fulva]MBT0995526.1 hypothetical protein [Cellulomonas fulva]
MAAMQRKMAEHRVKAAMPPEPLPAEIAELIANYNNRAVDPHLMEQIRPFLLECIARSEIRGKESVRKHLVHLTALAKHGAGLGWPLTVADLLTTASIESLIATGMPDDSVDNRALRRSRLLALAANVNPGPSVPSKLKPIGYSAVQPCYTPGELDRILLAAQNQPTDARTRDCAFVVSLCAGAGADSVDLHGLRVRDITDLGPDGLVVHFGEPRPRVVVVRARFEPLLRSALRDADPDRLVLGMKEGRKNVAAPALGRMAGYRLPHLTTSRLRASWLADLMTDSVPVALILQAAGIITARTLIDLTPHLGPWLTAKNLDPSTSVRGDVR